MKVTYLDVKQCSVRKPIIHFILTGARLLGSHLIIPPTYIAADVALPSVEASGRNYTTWRIKVHLPDL